MRALDEWGNITHNAVLKCGTRELDLVKTYTGHERDSVLGMYYAKARMYDTADKHGSSKGNKLGDKRFTAVDPVKGNVRNPQSLVQYTYVLNNPLMYVDPLGQYYIVANTSRSITTYGVVAENKKTALAKVIINLEPTGVASVISISEIEKALDVVGGNSATDNVYFEISKNLFEGQLEDAFVGTAESLKKGLGKKANMALILKNLLTDSMEKYQIVEGDEVIFSLIKDMNIQIENQSLQKVTERMAKAHEFVSSNRGYFFNSYYVRFVCAPGWILADGSYWENDYELFKTKNEKERIEKREKIIADFRRKVKGQSHGRADTEGYQWKLVEETYREILNGAVERVKIIKGEFLSSIGSI